MFKSFDVKFVLLNQLVSIWIPAMLAYGLFEDQKVDSLIDVVFLVCCGVWSYVTTLYLHRKFHG